MLKNFNFKIFFHINNFKKSINFIKFNNYSRKVPPTDKNFQKNKEDIAKVEVIRESKELKSKKPKSTNHSNYIDIETIINMSDPKIASYKSNTQEVAKNDYEEALKDKNINIVKEEVYVKIQPYFPEAVPEKEKSYTNIDSSKIEEGKKIKKETDKKDTNTLEILKNKRIKKKIIASRKTNLFTQTIKRDLPEDFYRMGLTSEIMDQHSDLVKRAMSINNASIEEFHKARMLHVRKLFARHERDTASPAITACALCEKIIKLISHMKMSKKDMTAVIMLQKYLTKRRRYMLYLKRVDFNAYSYIIKYYGMKDFDDSMHKSFKKMPYHCKIAYQKTKNYQL